MNDTSNETSNTSSENLNKAKAVCCECLTNINPLKIIGRVKSLVLSPKEAWVEIKSDSLGVKDVYIQYLAPVAAASLVAGFLGLQLFGGFARPPFFAALIQMVFQFFIMLAGLYLAGIIVSKLAPKFDGSVSTEDGFRLFAFAFLPASLAGVVGIIPVLLILSLLVALYCFYVYYTGVPVMTSVPAEKQLAFSAVSLVAVLVTLFVVNYIIASVTPSTAPRTPTASEIMDEINPIAQKLVDDIKEAQNR